VSEIMPDSLAEELPRPDRIIPRGHERDCAMADTIAILGDTWTFLVAREAFFSARRFNDFHERLAIPRATLTATLDKLVEAGIFELRELGEARRWKGYFLTGRGLDLYPVFLSLLGFGDRWLQPGRPPLALFHLDCRSWFSPRVVWAENGEAVDARRVSFAIAPDYWRPASAAAARQRRPWRDGQVVGRRPCSVERTLSIIGDRWTFLILREFFHGNTRFDEIHQNLGIATNILSGRLKNLVAAGLLERAGGGAAYGLTPAGWDLFAPLALMKAWADRWLRPGRTPTMRFLDPSGRTLTPRLVCSACGEEVPARRVRFITAYQL
jgi:DNA-binding HxlR family transcriptional regulator